MPDAGVGCLGHQRCSDTSNMVHMRYYLCIISFMNMTYHTYSPLNFLLSCNLTHHLKTAGFEGSL